MKLGVNALTVNCCQAVVKVMIVKQQRRFLHLKPVFVLKRVDVFKIDLFQYASIPSSPASRENFRV